MRVWSLLLLLSFCAFSLAASIAVSEPPPLTSIEFQSKLEESHFASATDGVAAFMTFLNDLEDTKILPFDFNVKKSSGSTVIRTEDFWDDDTGTFTDNMCKIRHRGYLLGNHLAYL